MTDDQKPQEVLAFTRASLGRRIIGLTALSMLGLLLVYLAFSQPPDLGWQVFLLVVGGAALWMADRMRRATASAIELTETELRDRDGTVIVRIADIEGLDRGVFAFKPSNGFVIKTRSAAGPSAWRPGLWWRLGRRVGVGGMTPGNQTKFMSEIITALMAQR